MASEGNVILTCYKHVETTNKHEIVIDMKSRYTGILLNVIFAVRDHDTDLSKLFQ